MIIWFSPHGQIGVWRERPAAPSRCRESCSWWRETAKSRLTTTVLVFGRSRGGAARRREGDDSSVSLHDGESVDSSGLPRGDGGGGGGAGGGGGDKDGDDDPMSAPSDQALMGDLRKGLGEAVNAEAATGAGGTDGILRRSVNQGRASLEDDDGDGSGSPDGQLGAGVQNVAVGSGTEDAEVAAACRFGPSEFTATGSYVTDGTSPQKGGAMALIALLTSMSSPTLWR